MNDYLVTKNHKSLSFDIENIRLKDEDIGDALKEINDNLYNMRLMMSTLIKEVDHLRTIKVPPKTTKPLISDIDFFKCQMRALFITAILATSFLLAWVYLF